MHNTETIDQEQPQTKVKYADSKKNHLCGYSIQVVRPVSILPTVSTISPLAFHSTFYVINPFDPIIKVPYLNIEWYRMSK